MQLLPATSYIGHQLNQWQEQPSLPKATCQQEHHQELDGKILRDLYKVINFYFQSAASPSPVSQKSAYTWE